MKYLFFAIIVISIFITFCTFQNRNINSGVKKINNQVSIEGSRC